MFSYSRTVFWMLLLAAAISGGCGGKDVRIVDGPYVFSREPDRVVVGWETALPGDSRVEIGPTDRYGTEESSGAAVTSHEVALSGLKPGRTYFYRVSSEGSSAAGQFTAGVEFLKGPYFQNVTPSEIGVAWEANTSVPVQVVYRAEGAAPATVGVEAGAFREVRLTGLKPGTAYGCRIIAGGVSSPDASFRTPAPGDTSFAFILYGDSRANPRVHAALVQEMARQDFDFVLHSGDFVDDGREEDQWGPQFFDPVRPVALRAPIYPALGNHDEDAPAYYRYFSVPGNGSVARPEAWYAFDYANAHFVVLDSNPESGRFAAGSEQMRWLARDLEAVPEGRWKFVMLHHPLYSSGRHKSNLEFRAALMPIFERYGVDMILTGHDHTYERTWPLRDGRRHDEGIVHVVSGGGGAELYPVGRSAWTAVSESVNHYCLIRVIGGRLDLDVFDIEENRMDALSVYKDTAAFKRLATAVRGESGPGSQAEAVEKLGRTGRMDAGAAIARLAGAQDVRLRRAVAEALARIAHVRGWDALRALCEDADTQVRRWAMRGLVDTGGPGMVPVCLRRLGDADAEVRRLAAVGLKRVPTAGAVPALVQVARDEDPGVRLSAVQALAAAPGNTLEDAIIRALQDPDYRVRGAAFEGVLALKLQRKAIPALMEMLPREGVEMRRKIVFVLGEAGEKGAAPALIEGLKDGDAGVRRASAIALGKLRTAAGIDGLVAVLDDSDRGVRTYSMRALRVITGETPGNSPEAWKRWWAQKRTSVP